MQFTSQVTGFSGLPTTMYMYLLALQLLLQLKGGANKIIYL